MANRSTLSPQGRLRRGDQGEPAPGAVKRSREIRAFIKSVAGGETEHCYPQTYLQQIRRGRTTMVPGFVKLS